MNTYTELHVLYKYVYTCIYVCVRKYSGLVSMNYVLYRFVCFNIYLLSTYHMARQCFKLRWVGCRGQQTSLFGGTSFLDGGAIKKNKQGQYGQVILSTVWRVKGVSAGKLRGDEFRLGVSGQVSLEIEYLN